MSPIKFDRWEISSFLVMNKVIVNVPNCLIVRPLAMPTVMLILLLSPCHFTVIKKIELFWYTSEHHGYHKEIELNSIDRRKEGAE